MHTRTKLAAIATIGLAAYGLYSWWVAPASLSKYVYEPDVCQDEIEELISFRRTRRGTRGKGRKIYRPAPIYECSLEGHAISLLVGARRTGSVYRDVQVRLHALVKLEGCTINEVYHPPSDFLPSKLECPDGGKPQHIKPVVSADRLIQAIIWSVQAAKGSDEVLRNRLNLAGTWVDDWLVDSDSTTIRGGLYRARLWAEWKVRTTLGLDLPLPSQ